MGTIHWSRIVTASGLFLCGALVPFTAYAQYGEAENPTPTAERGAEVYMESCVLCHGREGDGKAPMPVGIEDYPDTNLLEGNHSKTMEEIQTVISHGGVKEGISDFMPPFGRELTWTQLHSVALFIGVLREDFARATSLLDRTRETSEPSARAGHEIYASRCVLCHGRFGEGDGRMAKVLTSPPPANLTTSRKPDAYLKLIIAKGGEAIGQSKHMPPWGDQLSEKEIEALVMYINSIREHPGGDQSQ